MPSSCVLCGDSVPRCGATEVRAWRTTRPCGAEFRYVSGKRILYGSVPWCCGQVPFDDAVGECDCREVPPEDPVEERGVVVALLVQVLVAEGKVVRDVEQRVLV